MSSVNGKNKLKVSLSDTGVLFNLYKECVHFLVIMCQALIKNEILIILNKYTINPIYRSMKYLIFYMDWTCGISFQRYLNSLKNKEYLQLKLSKLILKLKIDTHTKLVY